MKTTVITREEARELAIKECKKQIAKYGPDGISVMCPMPGKNKWTWQEELDAVINDTPLENRDTNMIDDFIALDKHYIETKGCHPKFE